MNITVHIERLVLDGPSVTPEQRGRLVAALEAELTRLVGRDGRSPGTGQEGPPARDRAPRSAGGDGPEATGRSIAATLHQQTRPL